MEVFARSPSGVGVAGAVSILIDEFLLNYRASPVILASELAAGKDTFKLAFPVSLKKNAGQYGAAFGVDLSAHALETAIDIGQVTLQVWDELERTWKEDHPEYSPQTFLDFGGPEMWAAATAPPPGIMDLDDIEIESASSEAIHGQIFEGSARYRKGRITELGIKPNDRTGEIFPGSLDAKPSSGPVRVADADLAPVGVAGDGASPPASVESVRVNPKS